MIRSLFSAVSALENLQNGMDVIGNNIANVNTTGFKTQEASFQDMLYQTLRSATGTASTPGATNPSQVGTGLNLAEITNDMSQGTLQNTGRTLDLAIQGNGFFAVEAPSGNTYYKRDGVFNLDANGCLVDENGDFLMGAGTSMPVTIQLGSSVAAVATMNIGQNGIITYSTVGSTTTATATIGLAMFANQEGLNRVGNNMFAVSANSGSATYTTGTSLSVAGSDGFGSINSGYLESSNVNLANEFANLIITERSYEANTKMITTSDQMLLDLMNLKAGA